MNEQTFELLYKIVNDSGGDGDGVLIVRDQNFCAVAIEFQNWIKEKFNREYELNKYENFVTLHQDQETFVIGNEIYRNSNDFEKLSEYSDCIIVKY